MTTSEFLLAALENKKHILVERKVEGKPRCLDDVVVLGKELMDRQMLLALLPRNN